MIAVVLFLAVSALTESMNSREPRDVIDRLIYFGFMGSIVIAAGWCTFRARRNGWSGWSAFLTPVASVFALFGFGFALETSHVLNFGWMFPVSVCLGITCVPVVMFVCGVTAALTVPAGKPGLEVPPAGDDADKQM